MSNDIVETPQRATQIAMTIDPEHATLVPQNLGEVVAFANLMARSGPAVPKHLRDHPGACLAVAMRAFHLGAEPFALADKTYFVNDRMALEAQAIAAIILTRVKRKGMPKYNYEGEGQTLRCEVLITMPDGEVVPWKSPKLADIRSQNSPLWKSDPEQQIGYYSIRGWARRHRPDVIMGIYDREEAAAMEHDDRATSFEALEQRAEAVEITVVEPEPEKPSRRPQSDPAASKPAAQSPAGKPATQASEPSTGTGDGSQATTGDTGQGEADRPTSTESAQTAAADQASSDSATGASTSSVEETSSQADTSQPSGDLLSGVDDGFPGDRKPAEPQEPPADQSPARDQESPPADTQATPLAGFADFAAAVAEARDWPSINQALSHLSKTDAFKEASVDMRNKARFVAASRLKELNDNGYPFDFITDAQAYRCYLERETDREAMKGNRKAFSSDTNPVWRALPTNAKIALDKAYDDRDRLLAREQAAGSEFA